LLATEIDPGFALRAEYILQKVADSKPQRVLDAGCGRGFYLHALTAFPFIKKIEGFDLNVDYLAKTQPLKDKRIKVRQANIYKLPYKDRSFDFIICSEVLEHLAKDTQALRELQRLLKKGGTLVVTVPNKHYPFVWDPVNWTLERVFQKHINKDLWWAAGIWAGHLRLYSLESLRALSRRVGLVEVDNKFSIRFSFPFAHFLLYGLGKNLVERFKLFPTLYRFNFRNNKPSLLAKVMRWPQALEKFFPPTKDKSMNILMSLEKNS